MATRAEIQHHLEELEGELSLLDRLLELFSSIRWGRKNAPPVSDENLLNSIEAGNFAQAVDLADQRVHSGRLRHV